MLFGMFGMFGLLLFLLANLIIATPLKINSNRGGRFDNVINVFPYFAGYVKVGNSLITNSRDCCFKNTNFTLTKYKRFYRMTIHYQRPLDKWCNDGYMIANLENTHIHYQYVQGLHTIRFPIPTDKSVIKDVNYMGFRIFKFREGPIHTLKDVFNAFELFFGAMLGKSVPDWEAKDNLEFLKDKMDYVMEKRSVNLINISKTHIKSGDMLGIIRLDGIDPLLAYIMGSQTGHTAIAMWDHDGKELYVHESTVKSNYWPTGGVQRTKWDVWIKQALQADFNVVHLPLNSHARKRFNASTALNFFGKTEGLAYGYPNMMFSLIDTPSENLPFPASIELGQILVPLIMDNFKVDYYSDILRQGLNNRLFNTTLINMTTWECYAEMYMQNKTILDYIVMPELDIWDYHLTTVNRVGSDVRFRSSKVALVTLQSVRSAKGLERPVLSSVPVPIVKIGPSMVCDVFVCRMWKSGGLFGDVSLNCGEFTNLDIYSLNIFDTTTQRPLACIKADPTLEYCQIMGNYRMHLHHYNEYSPFNNMRETCPSVPPKYIRSPKC